MTHELIIDTRDEPGYTVVTVAGEADVATVPPLRQRLTALASTGRPLIIDLRQVSFLDVTAIGALADAARRAAATGGSLHAVAADRQARRLFAVTGLDRHIPLSNTVQKAVTLLRSHAPWA